jgi:hypothetical protein
MKFGADDPFALRGELEQVSTGLDEVFVGFLAPDLFGVHRDTQKIKDSSCRPQPP